MPQQRVVGKQLGATDEQMVSGVMGKLTQQQQPPPVMLAQVPPQMLQHPIVAAAAVAVGDVTLDLAIEGQKVIIDRSTNVLVNEMLVGHMCVSISA